MSLGSRRAAYHTPDCPAVRGRACAGTNNINPYDVQQQQGDAKEKKNGNGAKGNSFRRVLYLN
jgi:hypothetical protein